MARPIQQLPRDMARKLEARCKAVMFALERELKRESPVGQPRLWKSKRRPPGYKGGTFRRSWTAIYVPQQTMGLIINGRAYAAVLARNIGPKTGTQHSQQIPLHWIQTRLPKMLEAIAKAAS